MHPHLPWSGPDFLLSDFPEVCSDLDTMVRYSSGNPSFVDCEANAVDERCLKEYRTFFHIPSEVVFRLPGGNAAWNPPQGCMAIYGFMLYCGVTLPIPGFIARFLSSIKCAPMQLTPNAYRNLIGLYCLWRSLNFDAPTVNEIKHCLIFRKSVNETGSYFLASYHSSRWLPIGEDGKWMEGTLDLSSTYTDQPKLTKDEADRVSQAVQTSMDSRNFKTLVIVEKLTHFGLTPELTNNRNHSKGSELTGSDPIDSVFRDLDPLSEQKSSKVVTDGSQTHFQDSDFSVLPNRSLGHNVLHPSATLSGFFGGEGSARPTVVETTGSLLSDPDHLDPTVTLHWAMTAIEDREKLNEQVNSLVKEKTKLLADNAKLLANHGTALSVEKKKNEESSRRVAALEKQRDSLSFRLKEYERDFQTAKTEIGIRAISLFKHSPAFEVFAHKEFVKGVDACKDLVRSLDHPAVADQIDESMRLNLQEAELDLQKQVTRWESDRKKKKMPLLDVYIDLKARADQCFGNDCPGNLWLDPLINYGLDSKFENEDFRDDGTQGEGDHEDDDQVEEKEDEEVPAEDFQGDTGDDIGGSAKDGGES
ncbi:hypothetical protein LWI29_029323 [Acer saccharum]|uniref:Uncharacterized protein n=1 Tax=Acer saccharum TaxID=4024 RepID=A0AA39RM97_ACESA|nr:hypothetical protein LWI29_029323 [Acer saccharum]